LLRLLLFLFILSILQSCSTGGLKTRKALRQSFQSGQTAEVLALIKESKDYQDKDMRLLALMEKGILYHQLGNFAQSVMTFTKAKELIDELYTLSLSGKLQGATLNDNYDVYYGETYERSLVYFYLSLNRYLLYQKGFSEAYMDESGVQVAEEQFTPQKRQEILYQARAEILAWDSFLEKIKKDKLGNSVFKYDLMGKTFGAFIHEAIASTNDLQIALQLYKDARKILFQNYNSYQALNKKFASFKKDFSKLPGMEEDKIKKDYQEPTSFYNELDQFYKMRILELTNLVRPNELEKLKKEFQLSVQPKLKANVAVVFQNGLIAEKIAEKQYFSIIAGVVNSNSSAAKKTLAAIGDAALAYFAAKELGLLPPPNTWSPSRARYGVELGGMVNNTAAISFELPAIAPKTIQDFVEIQVLDEQGKLIKTQPLVLTSPLYDIAEEAVAETSGIRYLRVGSRLALKHLTAIAAAYATYTATKGKDNSAGAKFMAVLQYAASAKLINESEKADTRFWSLLPNELRFSHFYLEKGTYQFRALVHSGNKEKGAHKFYSLGTHKVDPKTQTLLNFRSVL
jgi:hypothetical protein